MKKSRVKIALKRVMMVSIFCIPPLLYLAYQYQKNIVLDVTRFGIVPEFAMMFQNSSLGMTHHDTTQHVTVVVVAKDSCAQGCDQLVQEMQSIKGYFQEELEGKDKDPNTPRKARFVVQASAGHEFFPDDWDLAYMSEGVPYLVPEVRKDGPWPAFVIIDDASYFRGFVPLSDPDLQKKLRVELTRIVSNQYLIHYVARQTLMWRKANGRVSANEGPSSH